MKYDNAAERIQSHCPKPHGCLTARPMSNTTILKHLLLFICALAYWSYVVCRDNYMTHIIIKTHVSTFLLHICVKICVRPPLLAADTIVTNLLINKQLHKYFAVYVYISNTGLAADTIMESVWFFSKSQKNICLLAY